VEGRKFVDQKKQAVLVSLLVAAFKIHAFGQPIDNHGEYEPNERPQPNLVRRGNYQVKRYRMAIVDY
jgi:hypothetical protein